MFKTSIPAVPLLEAELEDIMVVVAVTQAAVHMVAEDIILNLILQTNVPIL
jgi:hypothetical protein